MRTIVSKHLETGKSANASGDWRLDVVFNLRLIEDYVTFRLLPRGPIFLPILGELKEFEFFNECLTDYLCIFAEETS